MSKLKSTGNFQGFYTAGNLKMLIREGMFTDFDVYFDYPFEDVCYRVDHVTKKKYFKFYGEEEGEVHPESNLYWDAFRFGDEMTKAEYDAK
jgi:hypothetical protein